VGLDEVTLLHRKVAFRVLQFLPFEIPFALAAQVEENPILRDLDNPGFHLLPRRVPLRLDETSLQQFGEAFFRLQLVDFFFFFVHQSP